MINKKLAWTPVIVWSGTLNRKEDSDTFCRPARIIEVDVNRYVLEFSNRNDSLGVPIWEHTAENNILIQSLLAALSDAQKARNATCHT